MRGLREKINFGKKKMTYLNIVTITGYIGQNPEIKYFESGRRVAKIQVASKPPYQTDKTQWMPVEIWGDQPVVDWMKSGGLVMVTGELKFDRWIDNNGISRSKPVLNASDIRLLGKPKTEHEPETREEIY